MKSVAVVDLSWDMHRNKEALSMLSVQKVRADGTYWILPTGHVYGTWQDVLSLSQRYDLVILAVDSPNYKRKELMSSYKADRHTPTGDPIKDYNIYNDLISILKLCTSLKNVFYVKEPELEADDIIASFIVDSVDNRDRDYSCFFRDKDILQNFGYYSWYDKMVGRPVNRNEYLVKVLGFDSSFDYHPLPVKVLKGDQSDGIPNRVPRFPAAYLQRVCELVPRGDYSFDSVIAALKEVRDNQCNSTWKDRLSSLDDESSKLYKDLYLNYQMVVPIHRSVRSFKYKQIGTDPVEVSNIFSYYEIQREDLAD